MSRDSVFRTSVGLAAMVAAAAAAFLPQGGAAQPAPYFSSTYAASEGSPYKEVYGRTFGTAAAPETGPGAPMETAAPPATPDVVYVIENGRLLTYSAADYAAGGGPIQAQSSLPEGTSALGAPEAAIPSIANRLYGPPPLETAAGDDGRSAPIQLVPPQN